MKFKRQIFGFLDMLRFKKLVPNRRAMLENGADTPLPKDYRVNAMARALHPGRMEVELVRRERLTDAMVRLTFRRTDGEAFPFFRAGQYVSIQARIGDSLVSRPYSIVSTPRQALQGELTLGVEPAGLMSRYLAGEAKEGERFLMSEPSGEFHYETLRDRRHIVCIAGGSGITPFLSMAGSMIEGDEPYEMTLFYGARTEAAIAFREELEQLSRQGLRVVYVLSDEEKAGYEHGFVTGALLEKYVDVKNATFFLCGPPAMYGFVRRELAAYGLPQKAVRQDASCCGDRPVEKPRTFRLTVRIRAEVYTMEARENETLLTAMERAGLDAPNRCRAGGCGYCHSKWISGEYHIAEGRDGRRAADAKFGFLHPCVTYPCSDMELEVPAGD